MARKKAMEEDVVTADTKTRPPYEHETKTLKRGAEYTLFSRHHTGEQRSKHVRTEVSSKGTDYEKVAEIVYGRGKSKRPA
jgi:hypothetical protein